MSLSKKILSTQKIIEYIMLLYATYTISYGTVIQTKINQFDIYCSLSLRPNVKTYVFKRKERNISGNQNSYFLTMNVIDGNLTYLYRFFTVTVVFITNSTMSGEGGFYDSDTEIIDCVLECDFFKTYMKK